ncbi:acyl-CoA dehydrogenase family protein [Paraburkholderia megapolitana]|uniref:Acyl-CoA dehydrogenase n=1 Tax=Paraburkholderia megapolitana TaxID=420953 RepID=A0A1I3IUN0_9BURK|nr:acyl-CoA dehydrogenase family protein [Paraburkholderia megapolitana]QDQ85043.1 acyl-CoA dehydrogenase [Paraburkholderia megapolitana]SFI51658.1 acyl-CoA dehydrogenase [Paraburkholderia megapolitana]
MQPTHANPAYYTPEHIELQDTVRRFVAKEISPFVNDWDEAGEFPRELYRKAADIGLLGLGFPDAYGGIEDIDAFHRLLCTVELARCGSGGVASSLMSHTIGAPPIAHAGSDELKSRVLPGILSGEKISALAITEPGGGSDVAALRTTAIRDGDHYIVSGEKVFITSGMRADYYTVAVRTDPEARGAKGLSLLVVEGNTPGLSKTLLKKMGWWASDTAHLHFDQCRVPVANLIGQEGSGFPLIMQNFNLERFSVAASALGFSEVCYEDALEWARQRKTFGQRVADHQVIRHKLVDMATRITATRAWLEQCAWQMDHADKRDPALISTICMLKNFATQTMQFCADSAVQILGGMGYMRGTRPERIYREVKVNMIGGGTEEIMKDLVARQLEF